MSLEDPIYETKGRGIISLLDSIDFDRDQLPMRDYRMIKRNFFEWRSKFIEKYGIGETDE